MVSIDLNSDMGESFGAYALGDDEGMLGYVTSANVACGWHAGDPMVMARVVASAKRHGVAVGAHPGYPDLMGFGRRPMKLSSEEITNYMKYQIGALMAFAQSEGMRLQHVAPHGALGNLCQYDMEASRAICAAVAQIDASIMVYFCAGAVLGVAAEEMGLRAVSEIFADRAYMDDLSLAPRSMPGAMITDEETAIRRCVKMIREGKVTTVTGKEVAIAGDTLCIHGDGPKALPFAKSIREAFASEGILVARP
ncbi:MAG: 5-oxoprolinase subunit PxpA [Lachnospiraceae bacterium]|jgi:UPF0271 protein|nr:5-oxoprolinase subunit PxpA [Lachnospiraceae bacterium]